MRSNVRKSKMAAQNMSMSSITLNFTASQLGVVIKLYVKLGTPMAVDPIHKILGLDPGEGLHCMASSPIVHDLIVNTCNIVRV